MSDTSSDSPYPLKEGEAVTPAGKVVSVDDPEVGAEPPENPYTENSGGGRNFQNAAAKDAGEEVPADKLPQWHPDSDIHEEAPEPG